MLRSNALTGLDRKKVRRIISGFLRCLILYYKMGQTALKNS